MALLFDAPASASDWDAMGKPDATNCAGVLLNTPEPSSTINAELGLTSPSGTPDRSRGRTLAISRSEEHTSELQSLMRISYADFCLQKKTNSIDNRKNIQSKRAYA